MRSFILLIVLVNSTLNTAQDLRSTHQFENSFYLQNSIVKKPHVKPIGLTSLKKNTSASLNKTVFGFLPWWEYNIGTHQNLRYDLLTHIAIFSFEADAEGNLIDPPDWPWTDLINTAAANDEKLMLTITNFDPDEIHKLMTDDVIRAKLLENIRTKLMTDGFGGIIIDFENILDADKDDAIKNFLMKMQEFLNPNIPVYEIAFATPALTGGTWFFNNILEYADYLFIMGYDFYGSWSLTTGPSSPLIGGFYNLTNSLNEDYGNVPPEKLILGVPYYGNYWKTDSGEAYAQVTPYDSTNTTNNWVSPVLRYKEIISTYNQKEKLFDTTSQTPWLRWQDTMWNQIWYDDSVSLELKYDLVINRNLKGIGIWALGYDDNRTELWNLIESKFTTVVSVSENTSSNIPVGFKLYQNYPNPFNPSTVISWQLAVSSFVNLKIYDVLGREVATLVNEYQNAGTHNLKLNTQNYSVPSGLYFYRLTAGNNSQIKKMILLK